MEAGVKRGGRGEYHQSAKRLRTVEEEERQQEEEEEAVRSREEDSVEDSHCVPPSPVVHVRGLSDTAVEADLVEALEKYGSICYVMMMPFKRQALVEFDSAASAEHCVMSGTREAVHVAEQPAFFNFSTSQRISRPTNADDPTSRNKVLLLSVQNPLYPITTDVLYSVCNPVANVLRIVIFRRSGVQAMVEYPDTSVADAHKVKLTLSEPTFTSAVLCRPLQPNRLNVTRNDNNSWDYTHFLLQREQGKGRQCRSILGDHPSHNYGPHCPLLPVPSNSRYRRSSEQVKDMMSSPLLFPQMSPSSSLLGQASSSVAMVSGLHVAQMNCSRIFNLFCLYGNVDKVKFMKSVPGTALVEMSDEFAVDRAVTHLNNVKVFGQKLNVCVSRQRAVIPSQVFDLADGSGSYRDFSLTRNNRFSSAHGGRNVIQPPTAILHFYNAPPTLSQHQLQQLCDEHNVPAFTRFKVFDGKSSSKTVSGLLEFDSRAEAVETLVVLNHHQIKIPNSSTPFTLKLCFSTSSRL
ncbi:heteroproteinous nuclear ribonucleoprotein L-like [Solea senegalensis]|uniref:Heteroproteinous nuclear ribonucleoprotein L-like n=1 Tax=Solea senegalensis TaxID=28829 RepID=A0AAV6PCR7_SOLSE|nr:heteroproteinous nuclear ribonucleoprotein L-like [Solea senegalensis]